jgi:hypothetical protein
MRRLCDEGQTFRENDLRQVQDRKEKGRNQGALRKSAAQAETGISVTIALFWRACGGLSGIEYNMDKGAFLWRELPGLIFPRMNESK